MILNLYKPPGWSSYDLVRKVKRITGEKKVGHGGTLDPFAEGVLIIGTGKDTKQLSAITRADKTYRGTLQLGVTTDTLDPEGRVIQTAPVPSLTVSQIQAVFHRFIGPQDQIPPMFSAKKVGGVRLYRLARKNQNVPRNPVRITIHSLLLLEYVDDQIAFEVTCSKGTYIRVLAKDIAEALGTVGYLIKLVRTRVGEYSLSDCVKIQDFERQWSSTAA
jgi:tRNA pseudouridine55 synthase